ncbi:MAG: EutN/CcmL family microcompartment protein [Planctomycetota bacterium]
MIIAKVTGHVVATQKEPAMADSRLVVVEVHNAAVTGTMVSGAAISGQVTPAAPGPAAPGSGGASLKPSGRIVAAVDSLGAGIGDFVLVTQGSSARMTERTKSMPVDAVVIGIVESIRLGSTVLSHADRTLV